MTGNITEINGVATTTESVAALPTTIKRAVKRGAEKVVTAAFDARTATSLAPRDLEDIRLVQGQHTQAQQTLTAAQQQLQQAAENELTTRGALTFIATRIRTRYAISEGDEIDDEGVITRATSGQP